jgi:hypothetical protein
MLASSIWVGGYVALVLVARVATSTLAPGHRIEFFRALGRRYLLLGTPCLIIALVTGAGLLHTHPWDATLTAALVTAAALLALLIAGVAQARRMTLLRAALLACPTDSHLTLRLRRGAREAGLLRVGIGLLTLFLIALGALLAT